MKKLFAMILALAMVLSLAVSASAATITINQVPENKEEIGGTTTGETYTAYKIFDATSPDEEITENSKVSYTLAKNSPYYETIAAKTDWFTLETITGDDTKVNVTVQKAYGEAQAKELASTLAAISNENVAGTSTYDREAGTYTINVADKGYYLITDTLGTALIVDTLGSAEIHTKNDYPSLIKQIAASSRDDATVVDATTADYGEVVSFEIIVTIPATVNKDITVHDAIPSTMTYTGTATAKDAEGNAITITEQNGCKVSDCNKEFVIPASAAGKTVTITYTAKVNDKVDTATPMTNTAWLTYSTFTSTTDTATVTTYKIDVFKYEMKDNAKTGLAGAGFKLKNEDNKFYTYNETTGEVTWTDNGTEFTTTADKTTITFAGIEAGKYILTETTVPAGYNKADDREITITNADYTGDTQVEVLNSTGSELPSTGGMGTTVFYVIGAVLMMGAAVLMITKKRVSNI